MKYVVALAAMAGGLGFGAVMAGDSLSSCEEFAATNGVSADPCACIAEAVSGDADLQAEQLALVTMDDYQNASAALRAALDPCIEE